MHDARAARLFARVRRRAVSHSPSRLQVPVTFCVDCNVWTDEGLVHAHTEA